MLPIWIRFGVEYPAAIVPLATATALFVIVLAVAL
jgi:hypothetical protein